MPSLNIKLDVGNLTRDPELKYGASGNPYCKFTVAVNTKTGKGENKKEEVIFKDVTCFGAAAENMAANAKKGMHVFYYGREVAESWEDKTTGQKRSKDVIVASLALPCIWKIDPKSQPAPTPTAPEEDAPF